MDESRLKVVFDMFCSAVVYLSGGVVPCFSAALTIMELHFPLIGTLELRPRCWFDGTCDDPEPSGSSSWRGVTFEENVVRELALWANKTVISRFPRCFDHYFGTR